MLTLPEHGSETQEKFDTCHDIESMKSMQSFMQMNSSQSIASFSHARHDSDRTLIPDHSRQCLTADTTKTKEEHPESKIAEESSTYLEGWSLFLLSVAICLAVFIISIDRTVITTAIPYITEEFQSTSDIGWYGSTYLITASVFQPVYGRVYTMFSAKWSYLASIAVFEIGSLICGVAPNSTTLIIGRAIAGFGSAGILTGSFVVVAFTVPLQKRPIYTAVVGVMFGVGATVGPLFGGIFTDFLVWRWCFYINLPCGALTIIAFFICYRSKNERSCDKPLKEKILSLDLVGNAMILGAAVMLFYASEEANMGAAWDSPLIIGLFTGSGVTAILFGVWLWYRQDDALIPPSIICRRTVAAAAGMAFFVYGALLLQSYFLPVWFQGVLGKSALISGVDMIPYFVINAVFSVIAGVFVSAVGYYVPPCLVGNAIATVGCGLLTLLSPETTTAQWAGFQVLVAAGFGLSIQQGFTAVQTVLSEEEMAIGTAVVVACQSLGGSIFISVGNTIFQSHLLSEATLSKFPDVDIKAVFTRGATAFREFVPKDTLPEFVEEYNEALSTMTFRSMLRRGVAATNAPDMTNEVAQGKNENTARSPQDPAELGDMKEAFEDIVSPDAQRGVQDVEAVTATWSRGSLVAVFILMFLLYFVNAMQSTILGSLVAFVTSDFETHSLLTVIYIVANAMAAAVYIPMAKMLDVWGRGEGFLVMVAFATLGLVLMATSHGLSTFCAAEVFYSIGFGGMTYSIDVITADTSQLKNRALAFAFTSSPYMITAFAGPKAAEGFYNDINWRWGFGAFAIILPFVAAPLFILLKLHLHRAEKQKLVVRERSGRTLLQNIWHYALEFDALGVVLFSSGFTVFLLPFTLADSAPNGWSSGYIIAMIVVGFVVLVIFGLYETFLAPVPFIDARLLVDRTVVGACLLDITYQVSYYCWNSYFTSFLQVVNNLSLAEAGYVSNTFDVVSGVLLLIVGFGIRKTGYFKWLLYIAVPLYILAQGLMIHFRQPTQDIGYVVMCQIFIAMGGSIFILCEQVAILAAADHKNVAAVLALLNVAGNLGGAIGNTISGAIWTNTFENALRRYLPETSQSDVDAIYEDLTKQLSYEMGSPERLGIQRAYGYSQTRMLAAGTGIMALTFVAVLLIRNLDLRRIRQTKGMVF
ncbi:Major Facilitator Superfamily [Geosmithia morbida]|uniref:Major Facilitator Superfamily n=1 Tax=Geosmithia morbida TaxID=1094350 RepID=A0A9P4YUT7_9HYPO|nr:Major Facilitator Superfamily [Geosmithia morbida]KAF4122937.1 Major Facilitator Superfamily [Geosmithia morbida]